MSTQPDDWRKTACVLCSNNCGVEVQLQGRAIARVRGDREHPQSAGYTCNKAMSLDRYQNGRDRITTPLRRRPDGGFDEIDWDTAIDLVADSLAKIRDEHGGERILYYGGGGQGNHFAGAYSTATRAALGMRYSSNGLAQEKTGEFWVDGGLFGAADCHTAPDFEHAEVAMFVGKNPWHSHGIPRARAFLRQIAKDDSRALVVIDPKRTETAALADYHLQVKPGQDAYLLSALLGVLVEEDFVDQEFLQAHAIGADELLAHLHSIPISDYCEQSGVPEADVRAVARRIGAARSVAVLEDLGIEMAPHSTLNSYLQKLTYVLTGNFAREGGINLHTNLGRLMGRGRDEVTPVQGQPILAGLIACNHLPGEILSDHPDRLRAMFIESSNPAHSLADSPRWREAIDALEFVVVIDVAMTETAQLADVVLPAASQFEKAEGTFFTYEFPHNFFQLRRPLFPRLGDSLPEAEIHRRLVRRLVEIDDETLTPLHAAAADGLEAYDHTFSQFMEDHPELRRLAPTLLYETLGPTLPHETSEGAVLLALAKTCAARYPQAVQAALQFGNGKDTPHRMSDSIADDLGLQLFRAILGSPSGLYFSIDDDYAATWSRIAHEDGRIHLINDRLLQELTSLKDLPTDDRDDEYPLILAAGERRLETANTVIRDPAWRKRDPEGALRIHPQDAAAHGLVDGGRARIVTKRGTAETVVELSETLQPGFVALPNGYGLRYPDERGTIRSTGIAPNELTSLEDQDPIAGTPWHKHVRVRVEPLARKEPANASG